MALVFCISLTLLNMLFTSSQCASGFFSICISICSRHNSLFLLLSVDPGTFSQTFVSFLSINQTKILIARESATPYLFPSILVTLLRRYLRSTVTFLHHTGLSLNFLTLVIHTWRKCLFKGFKKDSI